MGKILKNSWALFVGFSILITAHGFQGNLLGVRAVLENFNYVATGSLMSGYFIGYFFGAHYAPQIISRVGHIEYLPRSHQLHHLAHCCMWYLLSHSYGF